jgi:hypothetical protein
LKYDQTKPFNREIAYQNYFKPSLEVTIPKAYIIPQGWHRIIDLLILNEVEMIQIEKDTLIAVESYRISDYKTRQQPYEGHYQHYDVVLSKSNEDINFRKGDYLIKTNQPSIRYILETLEPQGPDSFFNWNFFDTILQQKEGFSPYVWEDKALELLENNPELEATFKRRKKDLTEFRNSWYEQLDWLHKQSIHYEKAHLQYPIYRIN